MPIRSDPWMGQFGRNLRSWMDEATAARVDELAVVEEFLADKRPPV